MRLIFVADPHGSVAVVAKAIRAVAEHSADALILSGDLTGKELVALVDHGDGLIDYEARGIRRQAPSSARAEIEETLAAAGAYSVACSEQDLNRMRADGDRVRSIFAAKTAERLERWRGMLTAGLDLRRTRVLMTPGNDDDREIDEVLLTFATDGIESRCEEPWQLGPNHVLTLEVVNPTPWSTPRELSEARLAALIDRRVARLNDPALAIFNFHCPPYGTRLDLAPKLDRRLRRVFVGGNELYEHVGSKAVRQAIERFAPAVGLHGHIHEAAGEDRIGITTCLNPGSEHGNGVLHAYLLDLDTNGRLGRYQRIEA